jgi:hypothetical protein
MLNIIQESRRIAAYFQVLPWNVSRGIDKIQKTPVSHGPPSSFERGTSRIQLRLQHPRRIRWKNWKYLKGGARKKAYLRLYVC